MKISITTAIGLSYNYFENFIVYRHTNRLDLLTFILSAVTKKIVKITGR